MIRLRLGLVAALTAVFTAPAAGQEPRVIPPPVPRDSAAVDTAAVPQRDIMDIVGMLLGRDPPEPDLVATRGGLTYALLPGVGYNPAFGAFVGISVVASGSLGDPQTTLPSVISAGGSYSTTGQVQIQVRSDIVTPGNIWKLNGDWRYLDTTEKTYGLGEAVAGQPAYPMGFTLYRFYQTVTRRVGGSDFNVGLGYLYDRHENIDDDRFEEGFETPYTDYTNGSLDPTVASGFSFELLADTRDNPINSSRGTYTAMSFRSFARGLGSDADWQSLLIEFRAYKRLPGKRRHIFAVWNYTWLTFGDPPYFDLPAVTWDRYARGGRGYIRGRIRGLNQVYTEGEYRTTFTRDGLIGGVVFLNAMATSGTQGGSFGSFDPGGGVGMRFKFNKLSDTNAAVDFAWGDAGSHGIFFGLQEVF